MARSLLVAAAMFAAAAPPLIAQDDVNPFQTPVDVRVGRSLFERHCARCHGMGATGGETGPDLSTGVFRRASTDAGLFSVISRGVPDTEMLPFRRAAGEYEVWQLVAYLRSLSGGPRVEVPGDVEAGRRIYEGEGDCASCHMINGIGGRHGPDLTTIGDRRSPADLLSDLVDPNERVQPRWWRMDVTHVDGTRVAGRRMNEGTYSVRILDDDDQMWSFMKAELTRSERFEDSAMRSYADTLSNEQLEDLVAYLYGLSQQEGS